MLDSLGNISNPTTSNPGNKGTNQTSQNVNEPITISTYQQHAQGDENQQNEEDEIHIPERSKTFETWEKKKLGTLRDSRKMASIMPFVIAVRKNLSWVNQSKPLAC